MGRALDRDEALGCLLRQQAMLRGYLAGICADPGLVEDVLQDVAVVVLERYGEVRERSAFPAWLRSVARHKALQRFTRQGRDGPPLDPSIIEGLEPMWQARDEHPQQARLEALGRCLARLSERMRSFLELRFVEGLDGEGIAKRLGCPVNTVYVGTSRAYRRLVDCIQRQQEPARNPS